jgi:hypothetical protein
MMYALVSIILGVLFTLMNGKLIEKHNSAVISFYEFLAGVFLFRYTFVSCKFSVAFFTLSAIIDSYFNFSFICTRLCFTSVKVMEKINPIPLC